MKRKTLTTALLAGLTGTVGIANIADAVNVNPNGLGQVLIYPYYTVRGGYDSLFTVVNSTSQVKAVKVRFLEAQNSQEVLDFNLYLSPFDVWTAAVTDLGTSAGLISSDNSCTVPGLTYPVAFRTFAYAGDGVANDTLDRTKEGYAEFIEMGVVTNSGSSPWAAFATHVAGVPANCGALSAAWNGGAWTLTNGNDGVLPPSGGLFGGGQLVNVGGGFLVPYNAEALQDFSELTLHTAPGSVLPNLNDANNGLAPPTSNVFANGGVVTSTWNRGVDAVSAVFMSNSILTTYNVDAATLSGTDLLVNFPTKRFYVDPGTTGSATPLPPFTTTISPIGACERVSLNIYNREEATTQQQLDISPLPPAGFNSLCWEAMPLTFNNSNVLGSVLSANVNVPAGYSAGWLRVGFSDAGQVYTSVDGDVYRGLPVTGFTTFTYVNGSLDVGDETVLSNYAATFRARTTQSISGT